MPMPLAARLAAPGEWVVAFDVPFGLPRLLAQMLVRERADPIDGWIVGAYAVAGE